MEKPALQSHYLKEKIIHSNFNEKTTVSISLLFITIFTPRHIKKDI
jgi:hypothetical protein